MLTPRDSDGRTWRIELRDDGVRVYQTVRGSLVGSPQRDVRDMPSLGAWLVARGLDVEDLRAA